MKSLSNTRKILIPLALLLLVGAVTPAHVSAEPMGPSLAYTLMVGDGRYIIAGDGRPDVAEFGRGLFQVRKAYEILFAAAPRGFKDNYLFERRELISHTVHDGKALAVFDEDQFDPRVFRDGLHAGYYGDAD